MKSKRAGSHASDVARKVRRARRRFFRIDDFEGPRGAVDRELCRLVEAGELRRIRNGLYWRGPKTLLGMSPPSLEELLDELLGKDVYGWAGTTAANRLGLTSQVAGRTQVAVCGRPPRDLPTLHFVQRAGRRGRAEAGLSPVEIAVLEVLEDFEDLVEQPSAAQDRIRELMLASVVRADALEQAAVSESRRVRERLAPLLDEVRAATHAPVSA